MISTAAAGAFCAPAAVAFRGAAFARYRATVRVLSLLLTLLLSCARGGGPDPLDSGISQEPDAGACAFAALAPALPVTSAPAAGEYVLELRARSESSTRWSQPGNEALLLEVRSGPRLIGHLVLHQGADDFAYRMQVGQLAADEQVAVAVSPLSAASASARACVLSARLSPADEGAVNAPILRWPVQKRFDDLPVVLGWSAARRKYELFYTNENGGTAALCGGGAQGMQAEIARWGRGCDVEGIYGYGASPFWERCTGVVAVAALPPRREGAHPILYYGDGHNRLFESRGGYGQTCGTSSDRKADGDLAGWNVQSPGDAEADDAPFTITLRPAPVGLDALGYAAYGGTRERVQEAYAPWLYRLTDSELAREGKVDGVRTLPLDRYLYADVFATGVDGTGDRFCSPAGARGGFVLRARRADGSVDDGPQMTADYFGGNTAWKRIAIPLRRPLEPPDLRALIFDAYDGDGIYLRALGDVFVVRAQGDNGAAIEYVHEGPPRTVQVYVDDACDGGTQFLDGGAYPCAGGSYTVAP